MKRLTTAAVILLSLCLTACQSEPPDREPWIPVLEESSFNYLADAAGRADASVQAARRQLTDGETAIAREQLARASEELRILLRYDIPMTEVRQLVYDAERFYALGMGQKVSRNLAAADRLLTAIGQSGSPLVKGEIERARLQLSQLKIALDTTGRQPRAGEDRNAAREIGEGFRQLGNRVNLMATKADLVLSGADFR